MRHDRSIRRGVRANALWGRRGESRSNALWGSGKRGMIMLALAAMLVVPVAGSASSINSGPGKTSAFVPDNLLAEAAASPLQEFDVIVQGTRDRSPSDTGKEVTNSNGKLKRSFLSVDGVEASITGKDLLKLATDSHVAAITRNVTVRATSYQDSTMWQDSTDMSILQNAFDPATGAITGPAPQAPAIAIVDSGVQARADFGGRLVASVSMCSLCTDGATGDGEGHGTMVAGIAAGSGSYAGGAPNAPIVSIRTATGDGQSRTSDVVAAADSSTTSG
ncbi:MAG: hypothetical protein E6G36_07370 [Actinobacteria bacterium]|nr:MAG: hypothetical protein E6G36_07370 [Actinomycetota bacterium]